MPQSFLPGIADLLAYPVEVGGQDRQRMADWAVNQQMLQMLAQPPTGQTGGQPVLTAEQIAQMNPRPTPSMFPKLLENPYTGIPLRTAGAVGQVLQLVAGSNRGVAAPRSPLRDLVNLQRTQSLDAFRRQQAEETTQYRRDVLKERTTHDIAIENKKATGETGPGKDFLTQSREYDPRRLNAIASGTLKAPDMTQEQAKAVLAQNQQTQGDLAAEKAKRVAAAKETVLTNTTKTMKEAAPKVVHFVDRIENQLRTLETGPMASRYQEFMAGRIGAPNPEFTAYRTDVGLLQTLLMRMHVGARGGQQMLDHFQNLINAGTQSPENMRAALEEIRAYANDVATTKAAGEETPGTPAPNAAAPSSGGASDPETEKWHKALDELGVPR